MENQKDITTLLIEWSHGSSQALSQLLPLVYSELCRLASYHMHRERGDHTLQTKDLVHELYFRLVDQQAAHWQNRACFFAVASQMMRQYLVNHAIRHKAEKRGGEWQKVSLTDADNELQQAASEVDILCLEIALQKLEAIDPKQSKIVEMRYFGGLTNEEIAQSLSISLATVKREWTFAKAWLFHELSSGGVKEPSG